MPHKDPVVRRAYMAAYKLKNPKFWQKYVPPVVRVPAPCELCGKIVQPQMRGPQTRWCSPRCRTRAWEMTTNGKAAKRAWTLANKHRLLGYQRKYHYGLTADQYEDRYRAAKGCCEICRRPFPMLHVDHDHARGKKAIRGLLCPSCNKGLGLFGDDPVRLTNAAKYLKRVAG